MHLQVYSLGLEHDQLRWGRLLQTLDSTAREFPSARCLTRKNHRLSSKNEQLRLQTFFSG